MASIHVGVRDIAESALDVAAAIDFVSDAEHGGIALFVGKVRRRNLGREAVGIHYDIHRLLAPRLMREMAEQIATDLGAPVSLYAEHACGHLAVGDTAIVVAAATAHRDEAFRACRALTEAIKYRAPVWKQEHYVDGSSEWSEGAAWDQAGKVDEDRPDA
ncbi:molybdenum cofactor biosynthesis protein MoaE [Pseudomarimonas salicorniae]|uniref:Molybdopterin synthase catalytic subunit n=1 Tax=Pseudomarimonas salicorniae TaxID=2933270 RepID=A0ABT0GFH4_9GAMM|nr:molybdenum cofactor biosynthesis protein MoaE [Lysobacter sp. CAU 1642]MCK7593188.1 molybdenum cofactor biosynthesis protein MoaE [Lysobacter sp. CAU 1642]